MWDVDRDQAVLGRWGLVAETSSPTLGNAADEWLTYLHATRAPSTVPVYRVSLHLFISHAGSETLAAALTPGHLSRWIATLYAGRRRNTVCAYVNGVKSFLRWCWRSGYTIRDVGAYVENPRREESARWPVPAAGVRALLAAAASPTERALVLVLYGCGLRVSEAVGLRWADIDLEGGRALIRGKGSKQRYVGLGQVVTAALIGLTGLNQLPAEQADQAPSLRHGKPHIVVPTAGTADGGVNIHQTYSHQPDCTMRPFPYTYRWAEKVIDRLAAHAGLGHVTPHQLRHSFADVLVDEDMPILQVKDLLGHSSVSTTMQYLRAHDKRRAVEALRKRNPADLLGA